MAQEMDGDKLFNIGPWKNGLVDNVPLKNVPQDAVFDAVNVDFDKDGKVRRRTGFTKKINAQIKTSSLHSFDGKAYFQDGQSICIATPYGDAFSTVYINAGLTSGIRTYFDSANGYVFFSNGFKIGRILDGKLQRFAIPSVNGLNLTYSESSATGLDQGVYAVSVALVDSTTGEMGPAIARKILEIKDTDPTKKFKIQATVTSVNGNTNGLMYRVFVSEKNGTTLYRYKDFSGRTINIERSSKKGMQLHSESQQEFPPCTNLRTFYGYMVGSIDNMLIYSNPFQPAIIDLSKNFIPFRAKINMIVCVSGGIYVSVDGDKTYFLSGTNPDEWVIRTALEYPAIEGTEFSFEVDSRKGWMSSLGKIVADENGGAQNVSMGRLAGKNFQKGASLYRRQNGIEQIISVFPPGSKTSIGSSDSVEVEIIRKHNR